MVAQVESTAGRAGWIGFLSDYGLSDGFVGICHGVIAALAPAVRVIDVCHELEPGDLRRGAALLAPAGADLAGGGVGGGGGPGGGGERRGGGGVGARGCGGG